MKKQKIFQLNLRSDSDNEDEEFAIASESENEDSHDVRAQYIRSGQTGLPKYVEDAGTSQKLKETLS